MKRNDLEMLKRINDGIIRSAYAFHKHLTPVVRGACGAMYEFSRIMYKVAEMDYLKCHSDLPGSLRTKRLRMKRKSVVMRHFWATAKERQLS